MKLHPEDPRLTAFLLGELPPDEAAAVERAADADPSVRAELDESYRLQRVLMAALAPDSKQLLPRQRENIRRAVREHPTAAQLVTFPERKRPALSRLLPFGIAAAIGIVSWIAFRKPADDTPASVAATPQPPPATSPATQAELPYSVAILPAPGPRIPGQAAVTAPVKDQLAVNAKAFNEALQNASGEMLDQVARQLEQGPLPDTASLPELVTRGHVSTAVSRELELPVLAGRGSLGWIYRSVKDLGERPLSKAVRLEEILNAFDLRPNGTASISKGASLSAESLACPWKPSATLLMIHFQGALNGPRQVQAVLNVDPTAVSTFRLLGFSPIRGLEAGAMPTHLPARTGTTLLVEIEPRASATNLGEIRWKVEGSDAAPLPILRKPEVEPSDDARFAALLASYSLWLTRDQPEAIDKELVSGLARECAASDLPLNRRELLVLIGRTMELEP